MSVQTTFKRVEKKYTMTEEQYEGLWQKLEPYFREDQYPGGTILSIYYDTPQYDLIRTSIQKPLYKEKLRLRSYGVAQNRDSKVFLEIKKKYKHQVYKRRTELTLDEAEKWIAGKEKPSQMDQIRNEIQWMLERYSLKPVSLIICERRAYVSKENPDFRLTFDYHIRSREEHMDLMSGDEGTLLHDKMVVMELKVPASLPLWAAQTLAECRIYSGSYSKIGDAYQKHIQKRGEINDVNNI